MSDRERNLQQIDRLVASHVLHGSESLCKLLVYLAKHALDHPHTALKEYQIATEVLGRRSDFDPQSDSTIRVQAGRLRLKLAEYYSSEGAQDPIVVELPKGTYIPLFHPRAVVSAKAQGNPSGDILGNAPAIPRAWVIAVAVLSSLVLAEAAVIGMMVLARRPAATAHAAGFEAVAPAFQSFWKSFVSSPEDPWLIFSNAAFIGRPETGLRYFNPGHDPQTPVFDHYTGVGEVLAVHSLDQVWGLFDRHLRVKRGSLFSLDDAKNNNLIFLGSPSENLTLTEIPSTREFVFQRETSGLRKGDLAIVNVHPQPGEARAYLATPSAPLTEDYALIGFVPGIAPEHSILILAGTTTFGTQAAAEYVSRENSVGELLTRLSGSNTGELKPFEAVVRVKMARGVPVESELVALRRR